MRLKKKVKVILVLAIILIITGLGFLAYESVKPKAVKTATVENEIEEYGYTLKSTRNDRYKKAFQELKDILSKKDVDEKAYVEQISKMFIMDFYTLNDKLANTDVGGIDFVHTNAKTNFLEKAEDTVYKYVENDIYGNRDQQLPEVTEVTVEKVENIEYTIGTDFTDDSAYQVEVSLKYKEDMDYPTKATLIFVHEDNKLSLVEVVGILMIFLKVIMIFVKKWKC